MNLLSILDSTDHTYHRSIESIFPLPSLLQRNDVVSLKQYRIGRKVKSKHRRMEYAVEQSVQDWRQQLTLSWRGSERSTIYIVELMRDNRTSMKALSLTERKALAGTSLSIYNILLAKHFHMYDTKSHRLKVSDTDYSTVQYGGGTESLFHISRQFTAHWNKTYSWKIGGQGSEKDRRRMME